MTEAKILREQLEAIASKMFEPVYPNSGDDLEGVFLASAEIPVMINGDFVAYTEEMAIQEFEGVRKKDA